MGNAIGKFSGDDRIEDSRGLGYERDLNLVFLNSGADRLLAIDTTGEVVRDTGRIAGLNPGGGNLGPDGRVLRWVVVTPVASWPLIRN